MAGGCANWLVDTLGEDLMLLVEIQLHTTLLSRLVPVGFPPPGAPRPLLIGKSWPHGGQDDRSGTSV